MRKFLAIAAAAAAVIGFAGSTTAGVAVAVKGASVSMVQKADWVDCHDWDGHKHRCRDAGWDHGHDGWYGKGTCRIHDHDHYIGDDGRWHECPHKGGY